MIVETADSNAALGLRGALGPLHAAGGGVEVDAALLDGVHLPPPAPRAGLLAGSDGAGAGGTADAGEADVVQPVVGHGVVVDVGPHLFGGPVQHGVELLQPVALVPGRDLELASRRRLLAPHAGQPGAASGEHPSERLDLADAAAAVAVLDGVEEPVLAVLGDPLLDVVGVGIDHRDDRPVALVGAVGQRVGLLGQPAGVDADDLDVEPVLADQVGHDHALGTERVREHGRTPVRGDAAQHVERLGESRRVHLRVVVRGRGRTTWRAAVHGVSRLAPGPTRGRIVVPAAGRLRRRTCPRSHRSRFRT